MYKKVFSGLQRGSSCPLAGRTGLNKYDQFLAGSENILGFVWAVWPGRQWMLTLVSCLVSSMGLHSGYLYFLNH